MSAAKSQKPIESEKEIKKKTKTKKSELVPKFVLGESRAEVMGNRNIYTSVPVLALKLVKI